MQSSRRRKPKSADSGSSTTKRVKDTDTSSETAPTKSAAAARTGSTKTQAGKSGSTKSEATKNQGTKAGSTKTQATKGGSTKKSGSANSASGETSSGKTSSGSAKTSASKTRTSNASAAKAAGSKSSDSETSPKSTSQQTTQSETAPTKSTAAKSNSSKTAPARSTVSETSSSKSKDVTQTQAAPAAKASGTVGEFSTAKAESTTQSQHDAVDDGGVNASQTSTSGDRNAESADSTEAHPRSSERPAGSGSPGSEPGGRDSTVGDDVFETHPGVYRSGHERFDEARESTQSSTDDTTTEVSGRSDQASVSETWSEGDGSRDSSTAADDDQVEPGVDSIPDTEFGEIRVDLVDANPRQPRTSFDEDQLSELVHSIREIGVLQPVVVRQKPSQPERFELIMGERRLRATKDAGLETIPAIIRYVDDTDLLRDALLENLHRAELNPLEEAAAYGQLLEDFGCTQEELSDRIGRSRPQISNTLRLLRLPPLVQRRVAAGVISAGHARAILGLREPEHMEILAQRIVAEGLSVRASEEAVVLLNRGDSMNVPRATPQVDPQFIAVAERLGDRLDTKVNITVGKKKGKLSVEFANQDDLDRILDLLGVEAAAE
nr:ParB/RepB/Spo0J family partition protein [Brevibacterium marinum]